MTANVSAVLAKPRVRKPLVGLVAASAALMVAAQLAGCERPEPAARTVFDFKEDSVARDGVLSRCTQEGSASATDRECIAARRAAAAIELEQERSRLSGLDRESERKLVALRDHAAREQEAETQATAVARAEAQSAYDRAWRDPNAPRSSTTEAAAPAFGAPLGGVLPSIREDTTFDPLEAVPLPSRPSFNAERVEPPSNDIKIVPPEVKPQDVAVVPTRLQATLK
jgi:hypothetical protein